MRVQRSLLAFGGAALVAACGGQAAGPTAAASTAAPPQPAVATAPVTASPSPTVSLATLTGQLRGSQTWGGQVLVTGDLQVTGDLTVLAGTVVRVVVGDDQHQGREIPPDGFNDNDPTRLAAYATSHTQIVVNGKITAVGSPDRPILFTTASRQPKLADWQGLNFSGDGSLLQYVVVEWSRNGVTPNGTQPHSVIRDSIVRHAMWGCVSAGTSGMQVLSNDVSDCGHEGVDVQGGDAVVRGNAIHDSHAGVVVLGGSPVIDGNVITNVGDGIGGSGAAKARVGANTVTLAPRDSTLEWRYGDFAYRIFH